MKVSIKEIKFLYYLYKLRCLTLRQVHTFFYKQTGYYKEIITPLVLNKVIELKNFNGEYVILITQKGIDLFRMYLKIPVEIYNAETGKIEKQVLKAKDIVIEDKYIRHQVSLNDFVLSFGTAVDNIEYYDEKFLSGMKIIRPDGLIKVGGIDLFLEQDMGTESNSQLLDKWARYMRFLNNSPENTRRIVVLFIVKCQKTEERKALVRKSILQTFGQINCAKFDFYIGTKDELMKVCLNRIIPGDGKKTRTLISSMSKHGYKIYDGNKLKAKLNTVYKYYALSSDKKGRPLSYAPNKKRTPRVQEFLFDDYEYAPVSVLNKIYFHFKNAHNFDIAYSPIANLRLIGYVVVVHDLDEMYKHLLEVGLIDTKNVYFTTYERLNSFKLPQALFVFKKNGDIYNCQDFYFEPIRKEGNIKEYKKNGLKA